MMYPDNDMEYQDKDVVTVDNGSITTDDGWSFFVPDNSPVQPTVGMSARFYGKGIGYSVRGLFLDGKEVFYRTKEEDAKYNECQLYGQDAEDWLHRWDNGQNVWSIEMGGLGPGYEQAIQVTTAEILRHLLDVKYDSSKWEDREAWKVDQEKIREMGFKNPVIKKLGLSGAQWGAAMSLATYLYQNGPQKMMKDEQVKDRHIQVSNSFPSFDGESGPDSQ